MSAKIIDGKIIAGEIYREIEAELQELKSKGITPNLTVVLVGDDPASQVYVGMKQKACEKHGLGSETICLPKETSEKELLQLVEKLNNDPAVHGILVQLPVPKHINSKKVIDAIKPEKDVDGLHPINRGRLAVGDNCFIPCTPAGVQQMLIRSGIKTEGQHVVVVGRSSLVGLPFALIMMQKKEGANATVTVCHTGSGDLKRYTKEADILVAAAGKANVITADMVKPGCVIIDVGTNRVDDPTAKRGYRLTGDVDFENVKEIAGTISPVPGGVGPMTIVMLLKNTIKAAKQLSA
ncbi:bifunctional methylenetetrahydrofolate dehydrogenase/methenyltetrahydrofolate cyclohydrolase FolD [candidate division KSB1 bacterium]|nr:bifunctional methylenetetrahydrofolate dehydrogenase/methenyltetrahydrofolate cyclohydrolase FolD [candidate division KSB1 bacterium]